jgi:hypothetical protein
MSIQRLIVFSPLKFLPLFQTTSNELHMKTLTHQLREQEMQLNLFHPVVLPLAALISPEGAN